MHLVLTFVLILLLTILCLSWLQSKQKSRSYSFEVMNREKRQFVHEYCEHFGCESVAYDQEPKRNVVATAQKLKVIFNFNSMLIWFDGHYSKVKPNCFNLIVLGLAAKCKFAGTSSAWCWTTQSTRAYVELSEETCSPVCTGQ